MTSVNFQSRRYALTGLRPSRRPASPVRLSVRHEPAPGVLLVDDLFAEDIRVPAVLGKLAQHVEVHPPKGERAAPVAVECVIQAQGRRHAS